jgi:hypothetical protein
MLTPGERRALTLSVFAAACLAMAPAQVVSAAALLLASWLIHRYDVRCSRQGR